MVKGSLRALENLDTLGPDEKYRNYCQIMALRKTGFRSISKRWFILKLSTVADHLGCWLRVSLRPFHQVEKESASPPMR